MIARIVKYLSSTAKEKILNSLPYRIYSRIKFSRNEIRFSCELTTKCNLKCTMCTRSILIKEKGQMSVGDMDKKITGRIIEEIKKFHKHGRPICFAPMGLGEPLLNKNLFGLFKNIKNISKTIRIVLVTNGILLDDDCCEKLISMEINEVTISLNVIDASSFYHHMGINSYDKVYSNIENLIKLRNKSGRVLPNVFVQYLDYDNNKDIFQDEIKKWLKIMRYGDKCYIHPIVNQGGNFPPGNDFKTSVKTYPCVSPLFRFAIKINGDIYPCDPSFYSGPRRINSLYQGNIMTESPFDLFIDKNSKQKKMIEYMRKGDYSQLPECKKCNVYKLCANCFFELPKFLRINGYKWL